MKHQRNWSQAALSVVLFLVLLLVIALLWTLNVSGPARAYEQKLNDQIAQIRRAHTAVDNIERNVFRYITYVGEDTSSYYWFNEEGQVITTRAKNTRDDAAAMQAVSRLGYAPLEVSLGYGYENPAYVVRCDDRLVLLDYDSKEMIYEREVMQDER